MIRLAAIPALHATKTVNSVLRLFGGSSSPSSVVQHSPTSPELDARMNLEERATAISVRPSIPPDAWDDLFNAVLTRLENCADDPFVKTKNSPPLERNVCTKTAVLECVQAMRQLHLSLAHKRTSQKNQ